MDFKALQRWSPQVLSILRIVAALIILQFGTAKILGFPAVPDFARVQLFSLIGIAGLIELIAGALLLIGLFTRPVAFILSGEMAAAYFIAHFHKDPIPLVNGGTLAVICCFVFFYFVFAGPGPWSIDAVRDTPLSHEMT